MHAEPVFLGEDRWTVELPINLEIGIIPRDCALVGTGVEAGGFVGHVCSLRNDTKAVSKSNRHPQHVLVFIGQQKGLRTSERSGMAAQIHCDIQDRANDGADQLPLRLPYLIMQAAKGVVDGEGMIVLDELLVNAQFRKLAPVIALQEEAAIIAEDLWPQ